MYQSVFVSVFTSVFVPVFVCVWKSVFATLVISHLLLPAIIDMELVVAKQCMGVGAPPGNLLQCHLHISVQLAL